MPQHVAAGGRGWIDACRDARGGRGRTRRPTPAELFIAVKPLTYFAAAPPRKVTDPVAVCRRGAIVSPSRDAALIKVVDTSPLSVQIARFTLVELGDNAIWVLPSSMFEAPLASLALPY
ncbi:hypothetical protein EVAR_47251_1 [Eumeta japonica]|uniref:Uncharacterized protein n=1 Tax=Eumeta variegata TaxID=151549 RepID=A0A4C1XEQ3_EUMVA|nr:hypothetical protein EVAR_47251_1 [Eumeta japonica]